jgi:hypothetical protein
MNPWNELTLNGLDFALPSDRGAIDDYNKAASDDLRVRLELLPEPFIGSLTAPLVFLLLNPGYSDRDKAVQSLPEFRARYVMNLRAQCISHYHLDPLATGPGTDWWLRKTKQLRLRVGRQAVAEQLLAIQLFPYHSVNYRHQGLVLPSRGFTVSLVEAAIARRAFIVIGRGEAEWKNAVSGLRVYDRCVSLKNRRNVALSPGNMDRFDELVDILKATSSGPNKSLQPTATAVMPPADAGDHASRSRG